ncbi:MAG: MMPL family transporter, partial [Candidatus Heimdallarchaeota archaeon]|nr:MMPL family transporter [Candidatus Heimdallarchaeota archaeon]
PVDPFAPQAKEIVDQLEQIAHDTFTEKYSFGFTGSTATSKEIIDETYSNFPMMIILVIISIYALVGIMFRAIVLPARLITTVGLTIAFIYGAAQVVFEENTFVNSIFPSLDGVSVVFWMVPVMSFSIILGLGIDYDIFTIERIKENVWDGMPNNEAIAQGIDKTARVITGAGIIMMIAFGGMMFSTSYILMQFGFVLSFAVLLDTFLVRTVLVPAIMSFAEKLNWWPNKPPNK